MKYDFSLILPVQNQAEITKAVTAKIVRVLKKHKINYELVMVENGSTDNTWAVLKRLAGANSRIKVFSCPSGYGRAVIYGLNHSSGQYLAYMPSDGQCDPEVLPQVIVTISQPGIDLVKVFRTTRESVLRKLVSRSFNLLANLTFGLKTKDINASPTVFAAKNLKRLQLESPDSFLDTELLIKAKKLNWRIVRLPMRNLNRTGGESTVKPKIILEFLANIIRWRFYKQL